MNHKDYLHLYTPVTNGLPAENVNVQAITNTGRILITNVDPGTKLLDTEAINEDEYFTHWLDISKLTEQRGYGEPARKDGKIKVYEFDYGETNVIDPRIGTILDWIETDMSDLSDEDELSYTITTRWIDEEEFLNLPEWN